MKFHRWQIIFLAAAAGLACGFAFRDLRQRRQVSEPAGGGNGPANVAGKERKAQPLAAALKEELNSTTSGVTRWVVWMRTLERAGLTDLPGLARLAGNDLAAVRMIAARWLALDPNHLFEALVNSAGEKADRPGALPWRELGTILFEDWIKRDAAGAVAAMSRKDLPAPLHFFRLVILGQLMPGPGQPELALRASSEWEKESPGSNYMVDVRFISEWVSADPRHAAEFVLSHPCSSTRQAMEEVVKTWTGLDPGGALAFAASVKDASGLQAANILMAATIKIWSASNPAKAAAWLATADPILRNRYSGPVVEAWARKDAQASIEWIESNMEGRFRNEALGAVLTGMAEKNLGGAVALVNEMEPSTARAKAAAAVATKWFPSSPKSTRAVPPEAVAWISTLDAGSVREALDRVQVTWAAKDPQGLAAFLLTPSGEGAAVEAFATAAAGISRSDPVAGLAWAERLPEERQAEAAMRVLWGWQLEQPAAAADWMRKLPANDVRREYYYLAAVRDCVTDEATAAVAVRALASAKEGEGRGIVERLSVQKELQQSLIQRLQLR